MEKYYKELDILSVYLDYYIFYYDNNLMKEYSFDEWKNLIYWDHTKMWSKWEYGEKFPFYFYWNKIRKLNIQF